MTTYILRNDAKKYDTIIRKIKTAAKQTGAKVVEMNDIEHRDRWQRPVYVYDVKGCKGLGGRDYGFMEKIGKKYIATKIVVQ